MASRPPRAPRSEKPTKDVFDRVIEDWARERPDLDVAPIGVIGRLHLAGLLVDRFYERSVAPFGLRPADFFLLSELRRSGPPYVLSPGELSHLLVRSSGGMTRQLDQLEQRGWIRREPDPDDRRGVRVYLTETGRRLIDDALTSHFDSEAELLEPLDPADCRRAARILRELVTLLAREHEPTRSALGSRRPTRPRSNRP